MRRRAVAVAAALLLAQAVTVRAQPMASALALRRWASAVTRHEPGRPDQAAAFVAGLSYRQRVELNPAMEYFFRLVRGDRRTAGGPGASDVAGLFDELTARTDAAFFIRRAAVLHTDAAIFGRRLPRPPDDAPPAPTTRPRVRDEPPLLFNGRYLQQEDGRVIGEVSADWNWTFARALVDLLEGDREFAGEWYHAVDAYMLASRNLADLKPHLRRAADVLPDDRRILFDRGCYAETLGLPGTQAVRDDSGGAVPSEAAADLEAERMFRRAIAADPSYAEARVRLARLLDRRGERDEAVTQIDQALAGGPPPVVGYLAHLVAGRIAQNRGHARESLDHYVAASALFPNAQSALVGASHAAVIASDVPAALSFVRALGKGASARDDADPWWNYHLGTGRDVQALLDALWKRVSVP